MDTSAVAILLCDYGQARIDGTQGNFRVVFERTARLLIRKPAGFTWATVTDTLHHDKGYYQSLDQIRGYTYNLVQGKLQLDSLQPANIFRRKLDAQRSACTFTLPNVRPGSIIEFTYTTKSDYLTHLKSWHFQHSIPTRHSEYRVIVPRFFNYKIQLQSYLPFAVNEHSMILDSRALSASTVDAYHLGQVDGSQRIPAVYSRWVMQNAPALRQEAFITTPLDYLARVEFELASVALPGREVQELLSTWPQMHQKLLLDEQFGLRLKGNGFLQTTLVALIKQYPDARQRAAAVYKLIQQAVRYNGEEGIYAFRPLRTSFETRQGSAAEINLLLVQALRTARLPADPVLLSTRAHGRVNEEFPLLRHFNHVAAVVQLPDQPDVLLDATDATLPYNLLPEKLLGCRGRIITAKVAAGRWLTVAPVQRAVHLMALQLAVDERGSFKGQAHLEQGGYAGQHERQILRSIGENKYLAQFRGQNEDWTISQPVWQNRDSSARPLKLDFALQHAGGEQAATTLYLSPLKSAQQYNYLQHLTDRQFAADFGTAQEWVQQLLLTLPAGYRVTELPTSVVVEIPGGEGRFQYTVSQATSSNQVQIVSRLILRKPVYSAAECTALSELASRMATKHAEPIVLQRQ